MVGEDRTQVGLEFRNSMVGTSSVRINYFLYRLVCANGMMVPAAQSMNRVFHSGRRESFKARLERSFSEVMRRIGDLEHMLAKLGSLPFDPELLAANDSVKDKLFEIIPGLKQKICDEDNLRLRYSDECSETEKRRIRIAHDGAVISRIPEHYAGKYSGRVFHSNYRSNATIFDLLNVFTEYAKACDGQRKLDIEEKTGSLARYVAENSRKFGQGRVSTENSV